MKKQIYNTAVYVDMENVASIDFALDDLMSALLRADDDHNCIFVIKAAYGNQSSSKKTLKEQLIDHNFTLIDTPKIGAEKNRADLFISLDAFETLYLGNPKIDRYCFLTSDSDFTVIGDRLRKFGKEVWLVCRRKDKDRAILAKAFDTLLFLEDFGQAQIKTFNDAIENLFVKALRNIDSNKLPVNVSTANNKMKELDPSFDVSRTAYRNFMPLVKEMANRGHLRFTTSPGGENRITEILF
ncbi:NYN domain-containing protein [Cupriavidus sp. UYPR2.512]|uniref:NYN domain-containing protein n=1 Tax=Cupriavidus sp. UYPR2.512 TaxID=1080187 RepID=UPI00036DD79E|nr:NYN domain-containing protein [Cupriavidus sp. UYPR2.512]UIF89009.1 NYN domain-containing protein [Cupriavidus necator]